MHNPTEISLSKRQSDILEDAVERMQNKINDSYVLPTDAEVIVCAKEAMRELREKLCDLREALLAELNDYHRYGAVYLYNLPIVLKKKNLSALMTVLLGTVRKEYEHGVWIKEIKYDEAIDKLNDRPSSKDSREFFLHTDLSYIENTPNYFLFHCIENNVERGGQSLLCSLSTIGTKLSSFAAKQLQKVHYSFPAPNYYNKAACHVGPILRMNKQEQFSLRYRKDSIGMTCAKDHLAFAELSHLIEENTIELALSENALLAVNNQCCLHGRKAFDTSVNKNKRYFHQLYFD